MLHALVCSQQTIIIIIVIIIGLQPDSSPSEGMQKKNDGAELVSLSKRGHNLPANSQEQMLTLLLSY